MRTTDHAVPPLSGGGTSTKRSVFSCMPTIEFSIPAGTAPSLAGVPAATMVPSMFALAGGASISDVGFREGTAPSRTVHAWYATRARSPPASRIQLPAPGTVLVLTTVTFAGVSAPHMIVWKRASIVMLTNVRTEPSSGKRTERYCCASS